MKTIGIITIHKINNYGSIFQAFALQYVCEKLGFKVEIIDYNFQNSFHKNNSYSTKLDSIQQEPKWIKLIYAFALKKQHKGVADFVRKFHHLSNSSYNHPDELLKNPPKYDIYITGSDQLWNPRYTNGDPAFLLHFAPEGSLKIAYAASIANAIPEDLQALYKSLLLRYNSISVRENSGIQTIKNLIGRNINSVLDPTLLLNSRQWNKIANPKRLIGKKYILCYFLNYSFNAFPYVDKLAEAIQKRTGYEVVRVARPPHHLFMSHTTFRVGASPEDFLALIRDSELVLTTSFHGTAFAVNFGKPLLTIVEDPTALDSRQVSLMQNLGLERQILSIHDKIPLDNIYQYDVDEEQERLNHLREKSLTFLKDSLECNTK